MPPKKKLVAAEIALLEDWVKRGAADPRQVAVVQAGDDWWSLHPLPAKAERGSVDGFIAAKLREHGMAMAPEADRRTLIRRLTFWLDVVHYGESDGYGMDRPRMHAWPYRDYLIRAFNADKGYARFVQEQLAADALFPGEPATDPALWRDRQHWFEVRKRLEASEPMEKLADGDQQRLDSRLAGLEERLRVMEETWTKVRADVTTTSPKTTVTSLPDGSVRFAGEALEKDTYTITIASGMPP